MCVCVCVCVHVCVCMCVFNRMNEHTPKFGPSVPCDLPSDMCASDFLVEDDFSWITPRKRRICSGVHTPENSVVENPVYKVRMCYCQAAPRRLPRKFWPCCLPRNAVLASREMQMQRQFKPNLLCTQDAPPKTQTLREWSPARASEHFQSFKQGRWLRVWIGQGHISTVGWLLIKHWDYIEVGDITPGDCAREGRPHMTPTQFKLEFFPGRESNHKLIRLNFEFRGCTRHTTYNRSG